MKLVFTKGFCSQRFIKKMKHFVGIEFIYILFQKIKKKSNLVAIQSLLMYVNIIFSGGPLDHMSGRILSASTMSLAQKMVNVLMQYFPERD